MRRVPRFRGIVVAQALAVMMADHRSPLPALGPVAAGAILAGREGPAVRLRSGQDVVPVGRIATAIDRLALLVERSLFADLVVGAVQIVDVLGDGLALGVLPGPAADAVARIDGRAPARRLRAEISMPGPVARPGRLRQRLAMAVGALDPAEIAALAGTGAGEEERHVVLLRLRGPA